MIKRAYLVLLVICLCISNLLVCISAPQTGNAHQNDNDLLSQINKCKTVIEYSANTTVDKMQTVIFGSYPQNEDPEVDVLDAKKDPIEWVVLEKANDAAFLLSKNILKVKEFSNVGDNKYRNSEIRKWLNDEFLNLAFNQEENNMIMTSEVNIRNSNGDVYDVVNDKVFILGINEMNQYFPQLGKSMLPLPTEYSTGGPENYLRDQGLYDGVIIAHPSIIEEGYSGSTYYDNDKWVLGDASIGLMKKEELWAPTGVRPAIWVKLSSLSNNQVINNNTVDEINSNNLSSAGFIDANLSKQISKVKTLTKYDTKTRIDETDVIRFGTSHNENFANDTLVFEWVVVDRDEVNQKALLLSKDIIGSKNWTSKDKYKNKDVVWETSTLRQWLNGDFYQKYFTENEKRSILTTHLHNSNNPLYNTNGGSDTDDKIFLLSIEDIEKYFNIDKLGKERDYRLIAKERNLFKNEDGKKLPSLTTEGQVWWLRSPGEKNNSAAFVNNTGTLSYNGREVMVVAAEGRTYAYGTRPAMWVSYNPNISDSNIDTMNQNNATGLNNAINGNNVTASSIENEGSRIGIADNNSLLGDSVNVEGAGVYLNPDGTIQIGGEVQEGSSIIKEGSMEDIDIQYETQDEIDKIISDYNEATLKKAMDRVYYYAKYDSDNKTAVSISKKNLYNGLLGLPLFSKETYHNIEIKFNEETRKRLSKYAEFEWNGSFHEAKGWALLVGDSIDSLENVSWLGITPFAESDRVVHTEGMSYYQKGKIQLNTSSQNKQNEIYNKISNAKVIVLATGNVIKSYEKKIENEVILGNVERFEYVKDDGSHINLVNAYINCERQVIAYTEKNIGNYLYVKDGFSDDLVYHEEIVAPKKKCKKFEILVFGNDSLSYAIYGNKVNFLAGKNVGGMKKFEVCGGKMWWEYELDIANGFEDYERYYEENKDKW